VRFGCKISLFVFGLRSTPPSAVCNPIATDRGCHEGFGLHRLIPLCARAVFAFSVWTQFTV
jgi:hypothetical protein